MSFPLAVKRVCGEGLVACPGRNVTCAVATVTKSKEDFFFEKKKQKTLATWYTRPTAKWFAYANEQTFFASFFKK
jgi:hypothetical protein